MITKPKDAFNLGRENFAKAYHVHNDWRAIRKARRSMSPRRLWLIGFLQGTVAVLLGLWLMGWALTKWGMLP